MNILRWKRKSNKKIRPKTLVLFIFSLIMTTFAWFAYSKVLQPTLNMHMASWDMEYYIGPDKQTNPIAINVPVLSPTMEEQTVIVDIYNNGETKVDMDYQVKSLTIAGITYEAINEGSKPTTDNYITIAPSILKTRVITDEGTGNTTTEEIYEGAITNDITKFPFTIDVEYSAQINAVSQNAYGVKKPGEGYLKVTVNWIGDNDKLDSEWGYRVGEYLANNEGATALSVMLSIDSYQVDPEGTVVEKQMPTTSTTRPYLPDGYSRVVGTSLTTGLVIEDPNGNQYAWVEVPKSTAVYTTAGIGITDFSDTTVYDKIEADLKTYVNDYTTREDAYYYNAISMGETAYNESKMKMLKSIYTYGGFYIGRYEAGLEENPRSNTSVSTPSDVPVIKAGAYPYNWVTCAQARTIATRLSSTGYSTGLMYGLQWDLVMKYLETTGTSKETIKTDSTSLGNYINNTYTLLKTNLKYTTTAGWFTALPYEKAEDERALLTTGANSGFCRQNIYDLAGNVSEWTLNVGLSNGTYLGGNGGNYMTSGDETPLYASESYNALKGAKGIGFRIALISELDANSAWGDNGSGESGNDPAPETPETNPYLPTGFSYVEDPETDVTIADEAGNQYVWVQVPRTEEVYPTAGLNITAFTDAEYTKIENDLHTYTSVYRDESFYEDTWYSRWNFEEIILTEPEYNTLKNKMLKSVYQNGGFYVGKYETGIDYNDVNGYRITSGETTQIPVIKANSYVYNNITLAQAQRLASSMSSGNYTSSLMFGVQWDLVLKYMETKGASQAELNSDSTNWGNYWNNLWTINHQFAKYTKDSITWMETPYSNLSGPAFLTTGASEQFSKAGIYDIAGNVMEYTLEYVEGAAPNVSRGGWVRQ